MCYMFFVRNKDGVVLRNGHDMVKFATRKAAQEFCDANSGYTIEKYPSWAGERE